MNTVDKRHVEQAIAEVRNIAHDIPHAEWWLRIADVDLVDFIEANAAELRAAERRGDAEAAHKHAKIVAATAIEYLARGLA